MSAMEFVLTSQLPFVSTLSPRPVENPLRGQEALAARLKLLADLSGGPVGSAKLDLFLMQLARAIRQLMTSDFAILGLAHSEDEQFQVIAFDAADAIALSQESSRCLGNVFWGQVMSTNQRWTGKLGDVCRDSFADLEWMDALSMKSCALPLVARDRILGMLAWAGATIPRTPWTNSGISNNCPLNSPWW